MRGLSPICGNCRSDGLLVAECFDWIHAGGADGGEEAGYDADDSEDDERDEHDGG